MRSTSMHACSTMLTPYTEYTAAYGWQSEHLLWSYYFQSLFKWPTPR